MKAKVIALFAVSLFSLSALALTGSSCCTKGAKCCPGSCCKSSCCQSGSSCCPGDCCGGK